MPSERRTWHFGVLSSAGTGHLNPLIALSQELKSRGHKITFFGQAKIEDRIRCAGLDFAQIPAPLHLESAPSRGIRPGVLGEIVALRFNLDRISREVKHLLAETPAVIERSGVDALLIDEIALTGPTVAQLLGLPYFIVSTSIPHHFGWGSSSWLTGRRYSATVVSWLQGWFLEVSVLRVCGPIRRALDLCRQKLGLGPVRKVAKEYSCLAHIAQLPQFLDLPTTTPETGFYYTGPWLNAKVGAAVDFPWHRLDGRPIAYVTMGTTRSAQLTVLQMIADACCNLNLQLVISLGNRFDPAQMGDLPGRPLVAKFAPQIELLKRAAIVIAHGGSNTVFEALMEGIPMVLIPVAYDQPAIAARLERLKIAEVLPIMRLSKTRIRRAITKVLSEPQYRGAAKQAQLAVRSTPGPRCAADIIAAKLSGYTAQNPLAKLTAGPTASRYSARSGIAASYLQR